MTKKLTNLRLKLDAKLLSAMTLTGGLVAGQYPATVLANEFSWLEKEPKEGNIFKNVTNTVKNAGASAYQLVLAIGVIGLLFSIIFVGIAFATNKNAQKKEENKSHLVWIAIGGIIIFGAMAILGLFKTMGGSLAF